MSLHVISTILDSPFAFFRVGKEVAVELSGYKEGTYLGRPATLVLLKVSNSGRNSNSVTQGYEFELRVKEFTPPAEQRTRRGVPPIAPHPEHIVGATILTRDDEASMLSEASGIGFGFARQPTLDMVLRAPQDSLAQALGIQVALARAAPAPAHHPPAHVLPSNIPVREPPLCLAWTPNAVQTVMFKTIHRLKRKNLVGAKVGETDQIPAGLHASHEGTHETHWSAEEHYSISSIQRSAGVEYRIRGPGKKDTGVPPKLLLGIIIGHSCPAKLKVYPSSRTFSKYVTIRKAVAVPTTQVNDEFLPTCAGIVNVCHRDSCREFGRRHLTDDMWRSLIGVDERKFAQDSNWVFRRP